MILKAGISATIIRRCWRECWALAGDSPLEDVTEISEDTENMDWEAGSGSITVKLLWKGRSCSWDMDVEYDWIDPDILGVFNGLLEQTDAAERFMSSGITGRERLYFTALPNGAGF